VGIDRPWVYDGADTKWLFESDKDRITGREGEPFPEALYERLGEDQARHGR